MTRSPSPYRMSVSARGAQINLGYSGSAWSDVGSRRASSSVSQVSADDRRHLCERTKLSSEPGLGLTAYGSVVYQLKDANMEASGACDFVCRALRIMLWALWRQIRSRRYERLDAAAAVDAMDDGALTASAGTRVLSGALSAFLLVWFALGNYWTLHILWPKYQPEPRDPDVWCSKTLYLFSLVHLCVVYSLLVALVLLGVVFCCCQVLACPLFLRYK
ncbi:SFRICE_013476 [Gryllus bimaculatus]|nr:SFRICE_013476 [Gryllus bimaculatus]